MTEHARKALLIGNASFPADEKLLDLRCPLNDVEGLRAVLANPEIGGFDTVETLCDCDSTEVKRKLITFLADTQNTDTVLLYYSGHGKHDANIQLNFCTHDSEIAVLEATAVPVAFVRDQLARCNAQNTVLMLDCCYSGAAKGILHRGDVEDQLKLSVKGSGTYLLTASSETETAQEKESDRYGVFTKHLIEALETGNADKDGNGVTTMDDLYHYIVNAVRSDSPQKPTRQVDGHGKIIVAKSGKNSRLDTAATLSSELFTRVASGDLDASIATAAVEVARKAPSTHTPSEATFDTAITAYLAKRITLGEFVTAYWNTRLEPCPEPSPEPEPVPKPTPDPGPEANKGHDPVEDPGPEPDPIPDPTPGPRPGPKENPRPPPKPENEPLSDFDRLMPLLVGKLWKAGSTKQSILGTQQTEEQEHSALFKWIIPLIILFVTSGISETAIDVDTYIGGGFLGVAAMVYYLVKYRSRLNIAGWIISALVLLTGMVMISEGLSY
ncbi:caspase, EACC1-associated type [Granulosicoccus sp. 3-233]|uniref:caspase family protein n=1 Tax=Granulosicoccus sp. 3-233 TaxID=3417969 RepID=UPI003D34F6C3